MSSHRKTSHWGSPEDVVQARETVGPDLRSTPLPANWDRKRSHPPAGRRTPSLHDSAPTQSLPPGAPGWMQRARRMASALEAAIAAGEIPPLTEACIERAWAAWELNGASDRQIAKIAHLLSRAYGAVHEQPGVDLETLVTECSRIVHAGLPPSLQRTISYELTTYVVRSLVHEPELWPAIVRGTGQLLGWDLPAKAHAAHAVRLALEARSQR
jgi:hypothetical protein